MTGQLVTRCRACGSKALSPAFSLGESAEYVFCDPDKDVTACGLLQRITRDDAGVPSPAEPVSRTHRHRLRAAVTEAMEMITTRDGTALDIGCGDGTLMSFYPRWVEAFGVDQVEPDPRVKDWGTAVVGAFPEKSSLNKLKSHTGTRRFDIITAISVLGEQDLPGPFLMSIKDLLADDGVAIIETPYASLALMRNNVGVFHDRAISIYTLTILEAEARKAGLKIVRGAMTETEGGSIRLFLTHADYTGHDYVPWLEQLARLWDEENVLCLTSRQTYQAFAQRVDANRRAVQHVFTEMRKYGEHAHVLGADMSMKAMLDFFSITGEHVSFIVSRDKNNKTVRRNMVVGSGHVEIVAEEDVRLALPDYLIGFGSQRREILEHWREAIFDGVKVIFLTPELEIVDDQNYGAELGKALAVTDGPGSVETLKAVLSTVRRPRLVAVNEALEA